MSYFPDLSSYNYSRKENSFNVGWLDDSHSFTCGKVDAKVLDHLWQFLRCPVIVHRGFHVCELCQVRVSNKVPQVEHNGMIMDVGFQEIRVFSPQRAAVYAAPSLIYHYITAHRYLPPAEFIDALLTGPQPQSAEYLELIQSYCDESHREFWWNRDIDR